MVYKAPLLPEKLGAIKRSAERFEVKVSSLNSAEAEVELLIFFGPEPAAAPGSGQATGLRLGPCGLPTLPGPVTLNALPAADFVLVPVSCEYLTLRGFAPFSRFGGCRRRLTRPAPPPT